MDFFISYTHADRAWAEWIAWQLEAAGYTTIVQAWDFRPGADFVHKMQEAAANTRATIAVVSPQYQSASPFGEAEWRAAFVQDPSGDERRLILVRVAEVELQGLLKSRVYIDFVGLSAE